MGGFLTYTRDKSCPEKYYKLRSEIKNGDILLYRGASFLSKGIQFFDRAWFNHIGVAWLPEDTDRVLTIDMWSNGLNCLPLSKRMEGYKDFCILRPKVSPQTSKQAIKLALKDWDGRDIKYDNTLVLRAVIVKSFGIDITGLGEKDKFICSEFAQFYCTLIGMDTYSNINLITPEDFRRYIDENFELLYDEAPKPDMSQQGKKIWRVGGEDYNLVRDDV